MGAWRVFGAGLLFIAAGALQLHSQQSGSENAATVSFALDFPASQPSHYSISIRQDGHGTYESSAKPSADSTDQLYESAFQISTATCDRIFAWARQTHYFAGNLDSGNHKLAFTGKKTLSYEDGAKKYSASFNYSSVSPVQQLTALFQGMGATLEYGRTLSYSHRYQKLALDEELQRMETQARNHELTEIEALNPVLQEIFDDPSVMNVVRARAQRLLEMGKAEATARR
ncbi:MAG TPA: hypothetical protein VMU61_02515 [Candidatus Aquilonibacter sp.]|nr:hypothetical protein [Candidatus Aquilonibacter sp.]